MIVSSKVTAPFKHVLLLDYLATRFTYRSREAWSRLVSDGRVSCNNQTCTAETRVTQGDVVTCDLPETTPPPANLDVNLIYEDKWLLGIDKPANLRVHDKRRFVQANLIYYLHHLHEPPFPEAILINRLDKDTSGVLLVARDVATVRLLQAQFRDQQVTKQYLAVVHGLPTPTSGSIDLPIARRDSLPGVYRYGYDAGGKPAQTSYETLEHFDGRYALLELTPATGRTHQLRVHLDAIGHPIVGDLLYGGTDKQFLERINDDAPPPSRLISRQALHCAGNRFNHPQTKQTVALSAPLPADFQRLLQRLRNPGS